MEGKKREIIKIWWERPVEFSKENEGVPKVTRKSKADLGEKKKKSQFLFFP